MSERATIKFTLPSGAEIELKEWITIGEQKSINDLMLSSCKVKSIADAENGEIDIDTSMIAKMERKGYEVVVVSHSVEELYELPSKDAEMLKEEVDKVISGDKKKEEK